ncbi:hypothetical protein LDL_063 [Lactobacillus phage Ldl1]|uniref:Uncharacterized protein n=1 Tax=Lactobacillus phage Ldl1 TaxID=1552735 RepID=A0A0A7DMX2_9CAUD|nr:hypothetical protein VC66_gp63 [Lactobacillus phage Ldl1]AIS73921.1 hypothetical protein LDL_063 [Lactobacillus phage Ldl1]
MFEDDILEHEIDFSKYQVVALTSGKEIIVKNFNSVDVVNNSPCLMCTGIFTSNNFGNSWVDMVINKNNILYTRKLFDNEKRIIRQAEGAI